MLVKLMVPNHRSKFALFTACISCDVKYLFKSFLFGTKRGPLFPRPFVCPSRSAVIAHLLPNVLRYRVCTVEDKEVNREPIFPSSGLQVFN